MPVGVMNVLPSGHLTVSVLDFGSGWFLPEICKGHVPESAFRSAPRQVQFSAGPPEHACSSSAQATHSKGRVLALSRAKPRRVRWAAREHHCPKCAAHGAPYAGVCVGTLARTLCTSTPTPRQCPPKTSRSFLSWRPRSEWLALGVTSRQRCSRILFIENTRKRPVGADREWRLWPHSRAAAPLHWRKTLTTYIRDELRNKQIQARWSLRSTSSTLTTAWRASSS